MKRILKRILIVFLGLLVVLMALNFPVATFSKGETNGTYDHWMADTLSGEERIIDVAMLGAHDAFTSQMSILSSVDEASADSIQTGFIGFLIKGFSYRQSKTQTATVTELLQAGVRYFDIRLTFQESSQTWMTVHTYFSTPLSDILTEISAFLSNHPGEFLILDIQHVNGVDYADTETFDQIRTLFEDAGVLDYALSEDVAPLDEVTVNDMTDNMTQAGVVILSKYIETDLQFFDYRASIRSAWANTDDPTLLFQFLTSETELINNHAALTGNQVSDNSSAVDSLEGFRVMQAVLTMQMSGPGIVQGITDWSLLAKAQRFNGTILDQEGFDDWLHAMPIVMVDAANSTQADFLDRMMEKIIEFNEN